MGKTEEAEAAFKKATTASRKNYGPVHRYKRRKYPAAPEDLKAAVAKRYLLTAAAWANAGDKARARADYQQASKVDPRTSATVEQELAKLKDQEVVP